MPTKVHDLAKRRHALRVRIHGDERRLAIAYPEDAEKLSEDLEREQAMLAELDEQLDSAKDETRQQLRDAVDAFFAARDTLLKLSGYFQDDGFRDLIFTYCHQSRSTGTGIGGIDSSTLDPVDTLKVKNALLRVADMQPAREPEVSDSQRLHEERVRNERAGRGHFTDDELKRQAEDPLTFAHGHGARVLRKGRLSNG